MAVEDAAKHLILRHFLGFGLHHQNGRFGTGDHHVERRIGQRLVARVQQVATVRVANAGRGDGAVEGDAGDGQRGGRADQGDDVRVHVAVYGHDRGNHLHGVHEAGREQRPNRPVDEPRSQRLLVRGAPFAAQEAARDLAGGVELLLVVDGEGEEILPRIGRRIGDHGAEHHRVAHRRHHRAGRLTSDLVGFQNHAMIAELELLTYWIQCVSPSFCLLSSNLLLTCFLTVF